VARLKIVDDFVARFAADSSTRARSLIISVFGDAIAVHGNSVWTGSLISALEPLGLNARQLRTAMFRLVGDGWLESRKLGRRSFYGLTRSGLRHSVVAARRIYEADPPEWDGRWTLVATTLLDAPAREELRRELKWLGFGPLAQGVLGHPSADTEALGQTLHDLGLGDRVVVMHARTADVVSDAVMSELAHGAWQLDTLQASYAAFIERFLPLKKALARSRSLDDEQCFQLRTILIDQYRRILLADADLPGELLPAGWPGDLARKLTADLYRSIEAGAERHVVRAFENATGPLPPADRRYLERFGGLR